ncbi:MAG TPA: thioredoxin family protein [Smithellaceae bacterium]|nr:thioredoxin family protein [Smithellaceae bacterium]
MTNPSVNQVNVDGRLIGIVDLEEALQKAISVCSGKSDSEISDFLVREVSGRNYIPSSTLPAYARALLREYKAALNLPVDPEPATGLTVLVLGAGCARCDQLQSDIRDVLSQMQIAADVRHVTDIREMSRFGVLGAPALVINNRVAAVGEVPPKSLIRQWITDALKNGD